MCGQLFCPSKTNQHAIWLQSAALETNATTPYLCRWRRSKFDQTQHYGNYLGSLCPKIVTCLRHVVEKQQSDPHVLQSSRKKTFLKGTIRALFLKLDRRRSMVGNEQDAQTTGQAWEYKNFNLFAGSFYSTLYTFLHFSKKLQAIEECALLVPALFAEYPKACQQILMRAHCTIKQNAWRYKSMSSPLFAFSNFQNDGGGDVCERSTSKSLQ